MNQQQQTPLQKLISDRQRIQQACTVQEQKLNADFTYIQENAGNLLLSGVSTLLFSNGSSKSGTGSKEPATKMPGTPSLSLGLSDYLSLAQSLAPVAWEVARPLLTAWGIQKVQTWLIRKLLKKKK